MSAVRQAFGGLRPSIPAIATTLLLIAAGATAVLAFAPFGWYPLAVLALAILFNQWLSDSPCQAFWHGGLFGLGFFGAGVSWVYVSVHSYGHVMLPVAAMIAALFILVLAVFPAGLGYLARRYFPAPELQSLLLVFPAGWLLAEWLRGWIFTGFPWLDIGASQIDSPLAGYLPLLGEFGVSWLVAVTAGALLCLLRDRRRATVLLLPVLIWGSGTWLDRQEWTSPRGEAIGVSLVQGNVAQEDKWLPENMQATLVRYAEMSFDGTHSDVYVWPETAIPAFYDQVDESYIPYLQEQLEEQGAALLTGVPVLERDSWQYYNGIVALGQAPAFYYKQHLVAFGEYLPLRWLIGDTLDALAVPNADFTPGNAGQPLLQAAGYPIGTSICFEIAFGSLIAAVVPEAAMLVNVSNDGWFGDSLAPHQHLDIARVRAKETGRPLLRATNTGISAIIDHHGEILARSTQFEQVVVRGEVVPMLGETPFVRFGNWPVLVIAVLSFLVVFLRRSQAKT
ncbi:MAG: apolipoprotein N-acyltransferase [Gammaproteobacteria bacterium]|nr:apolipoprotein N-acyltransferase [Gammaproteobacteria bacterium]